LPKPPGTLLLLGKVLFFTLKFKKDFREKNKKKGLPKMEGEVHLPKNTDAPGASPRRF